MHIHSLIRTIGALWGEGEDNWVVLTSRRFVLAGIALCIVLLLWRYPILPPLVPLWYSKPWGADRLAHPLWLFLLPTGSAIVLMINAIAGKLLPRDLLVFHQMLALATLLVATLSLVTLTKIIFLVS
ncbi:hypothetical protein HY411_03165 [Candidatus Gottesmanbacteria bacterium]|nr:hypothetical protein [Candidatus Gottesmanbacteria bacterium]